MVWTATVIPSLAPSVSTLPRAGNLPPRANPKHPTIADRDIIYRLQASRPLPRIDCVTTIKTLMLRNHRYLEHFNRLTHRGRRLINASLALGCVSVWAWMGTDVATGRVLAIVTYVCFFPPLVFGFLAMRVDIVKLLFKTYEFWFITFNSAASAALLCVYLHDAARSLLPIVTFAWYVRASLVDANCSNARATAFALAIGALSVAIFMIGVTLELMPATHSVMLFSVNGHVVGSEDFALNGLGIVLLLLARNAYRKYSTAPPQTRRAGSDSSTAARVRLIGYRTRIGLVQCNPQPGHVAILPLNEATSIADPMTPCRPHDKTSQLLFAAPSEVFHAYHVLWPRAFDALPLPLHNLPMWVISRAAIAIGIVADLRPYTPCYARAALACTAVYGGLSLALCNRALLRLLSQSFDVQFLFMQHAMAHLAAGFILHWENRSLLTLTSWMWILWVLTVDALTPVAKTRLFISRRFLVIVLLKLLLEQIAFCVAFTYLPFDNRTILTLHVSKQRTIEIKAIPFFLTRLLSMFWWTGRLLWRVCTQDANELVVIQGRVDFEDFELRRKFLKRQTRGRSHSPQRQLDVVLCDTSSSRS